MTKKIIEVLQKDVKDCGACSLQSIIRFYGGYVSLEKIREDTNTTIKGTSVYHLTLAAKKYGFDAIAKKYLDNNLTQIALPAIVHVKYPNGLLHFMVLYKVNKKVILMDPAKGKITLPIQEFLNIFTGVAIEFSVKRPIMLQEKESSLYHLFFRIIMHNKKLFFNIFLLTISLTFFTILHGMYFKVGYEMITNYFDTSYLKYIIYLFFFILIIKTVSSYLKNYYENHLNKNIDVSILGDFISHIFNLPLKVIESRSAGEIISRVNEISSIKELFSQIFISSFLDLILSLSAIICLFCINGKLSLILCLTISIYIIVSFIFNKYLYKRVKENINLQTEVNTSLIENIEMIDSIKNLNATPKVLETLEKVISNLLYDNYTFSKFMNAFNTSEQIIIDLGLFIVNTYGLFLIKEGTLSIINLVTFNTLLAYFTTPIKELVALLPKYNFLRASFRKIGDFIDLKEEKVGKKDNFINGNIIFQNIDYSYDHYHKILDNFSLTIKKGEKIMLKGPSGSGKSTICGLLQKRWNPEKGQIIIGDKNINDYSNYTIRENICYVSQKEKLYSDTIENNILFYRSKKSLYDKVCRICQIENIVNKKSFRYEFSIDNNAVNISGGEKQRIILARALLSNSPILVLDEALSETDYFLEKNIISNIIKEFPEKTLIYISHKNQAELFEKVIEIKGVSHEV